MAPKLLEKKATFWVAVLFVGPLALPLLWRDSRYSAATKFLITLLVLAFTAYLFWFTGQQTMEAVKVLQPLLQQQQEQISQ